MDAFDRFMLVLVIISIIALLYGRRKKGTPEVSTIDNTEDDIDALTSFIENLPPQLKTSLAEGTISVSIDWIEVTRDEDDYPTIKPRLVIKSNKVAI